MRVLTKKTIAVFAAALLALMTLGVAASPTAEAIPPDKAAFAIAAPQGNGAECPAGSIEDINGQCRKPVAEVDECPQGALGVPGGCYIFVDKAESRTGEFFCRPGSFEDSKGYCRMPVATVTVCPTGSLGVPGGCYIVVHKVLPRVFTAIEFAEPDATLTLRALPTYERPRLVMHRQLLLSH